MSFILQQALAAHQKGDTKQAEKLYKEQLQRSPDDINALQLIGTLYASQGKLEQAIDMMQKSLSINNEQMPVHANLAICYKRSGWFEHAIKQYRKMITLDGSYRAAYTSLIRLLIDQKDFAAARKWVESTLIKFAGELIFLQLDAEISRHLEDYSGAIEKYRLLLSKYPERDDLFHDLALTLRLSGNPTEALKHYVYLRNKGLQSYQLFHNVANAYSDLGMLPEAIKNYRSAISLRPSYVPSHVNLNELLWEVGNKNEFLLSFQQAFPLDVNNLELKCSYCYFLLRLTKYQLCVDFLSSIPESTPKSAKYYCLMGRAHLGLGKKQDGIGYFRMALKSEDADSQVTIELAQALIETGSIDEAEQRLADVLHNTPDNQLALALRGVCWRLLEDPRERQLNDYDNLVKEYQIDAPVGFASQQEFCQKLNDYLVKQHTGTNQPLEQTLTGGTQTRGNLFDDQEPIIQELISCLKKAIKTYIKTTVLKNSDCTDMQICESSELTFTGSWSVRLKSGGHHTSHVHPMGTLSSAFYVALPKEVEQSKDSEGYFALGKPNVKTQTSLEPQKFVKPAVGKLVLFPSYMWHSTLPFESEQHRITVAFDVKFLHSES